MLLASHTQMVPPGARLHMRAACVDLRAAGCFKYGLLLPQSLWHASTTLRHPSRPFLVVSPGPERSALPLTQAHGKNESRAAGLVLALLDMERKSYMYTYRYRYAWLPTPAAETMRPGRGESDTAGAASPQAPLEAVAASEAILARTTLGAPSRAAQTWPGVMALTPSVQLALKRCGRRGPKRWECKHSLGPGTYSAVEQTLDRQHPCSGM